MKAFQKVGGVGYLVQFCLTALSAAFIVVLLFTSSITSPLRQISSSAPGSASPPFNIGASLTLGFLIPSIPLVLISAGWLLAGREGRIGLFTATGVIGLVSTALTLSGLAGISSFLSSSLTSAGQTGALLSPSGLTNLVVSIGVAGLGAFLSFVFFVLLIVSLFRAARTYEVKMLRYAAIGMIALIVIAIVGVVTTVVIAVSEFVPSVLTASTSSQAPLISLTFVEALLIVMALVLLTSATTSLFAGLGFLRAKVPALESPPAPTVPEPSQASPSSPPGPVQLVKGVRRCMAI